MQLEKIAPHLADESPLKHYAHGSMRSQGGDSMPLAKKKSLIVDSMGQDGLSSQNSILNSSYHLKKKVLKNSQIILSQDS
mmetsp:Transcript_21064/g.32630  ORF Transcript_21064/g.32630 Transcript_21064/m.32630 type:complete len:80 (-) Transcript_21064:1188-1427(-)